MMRTRMRQWKFQADRPCKAFALLPPALLICFTLLLHCSATLSLFYFVLLCFVMHAVLLPPALLLCFTLLQLFPCYFATRIYFAAAHSLRF